jgi:transglutaminase-like putative cysteine protease
VTEHRQERIGFMILLYFFSFLLLWEWIRPLETITDTGNANLFVLFIAMTFVLYIFNIKRGIGIVLKIIFIFFALHHLFYRDYFLQLSWVQDFLKDLSHNISRLFAGNWDLLSGVFRSLLFFILLWLITYLLRYWLTVRRNIFIFFVMTVIYITVLDTFTPYYGDWSIVRTITIGFALLGLLYFKRLIEQNRIANTKNNWAWWLVPLAVMISGCTLFALAAPKAEALWPDPVPYIKAHIGNEKQKGRGSGGVSTVGYRADDSQLGGPFQGDKTVVFEAKVQSRQYWRVETKDTYTGKGWVSTETPNNRYYLVGKEISTSVGKMAGKNYTSQKKAFIQYKNRSSMVVYPYGLETISAGENIDSFQVNHSIEKVIPMIGLDKANISKYTITYTVQMYSIKELKKAPPKDLSVGPRYLQLPVTLPQRVRDLAIKITSGQNNQYDKAKAIEEYFQTNGFVYDQKNVAIPKKNEDYVDQFLFETKKGYCDNFSTSMVALLRSIGIPSRWVKGFSAGDYLDTVDDNYKMYKVTNNNAHSWVEVFFPNVGWVPFEPTIGFTNNAIFRDDVNKEAAASTTPDDTKNSKELQKKPKQQVSQQDTSTTEKFSLSAEWKKIINYVKLHWLRFVLILCLIFAAVWFAYLKRGKWMPFFLIFHYRKKKEPDIFPKAYLSLLKQLERYGIKKQNGQTLREFANYVDSFFETSSMRRLTEHYERSIYSGQKMGIKWEETRELWENLIKKTSG